MEHMRCDSCKSKFSENQSPNMLKCGHLRCTLCTSSILFGANVCSICKVVSSNAEVQHYTQHLRTLFKINVETAKSVTEAENRVARYEKEMGEMKEKIEKISKSRNCYVTCKECKNSDIETNMQICQTCPSKIDSNQPGPSAKTEVSVESLAICSTCALRKHVKHCHAIEEYFPIVAKKRFVEHSSLLKQEREPHQKDMELLKSNVDEMFLGFRKSEGQFNRMTDMIRRSKTTLIQKDIVARVSESMSKFNAVLLEVKESVTSKTETIKKMLDELTESNDKQNLKDCHEIVPMGLISNDIPEPQSNEVSVPKPGPKIFPRRTVSEQSVTPGKEQKDDDTIAFKKARLD